MRSLLAVLIFCFADLALGNSVSPAHSSPLYRPGQHQADPRIDQDPYLGTIQPLMAARCVACHGCYEAPCQMNLQSYSGLERGFHPTPTFSSSRLGTMPHATRWRPNVTPEAWRAIGFRDVSSEGSDSILARLLTQHLDHAKDSEDLGPLEPLRKRWLDEMNPQCIAKGDDLLADDHAISAEAYLQRHPLGGMPFGLARLSDPEYAAFEHWLARGTLGPGPSAQAALASPRKPEVIAPWEAFLNLGSIMGRHSARYIYEHTFSAHWHFDESPGEFFRIVRSRTPPGEPISEIHTDLPTDNPYVADVEDDFYYRLEKITEVIVQKRHNVWNLNAARLERLKALFHNKAAWDRWHRITGAADAERNMRPHYHSKNPFVYFLPIPAEARARFMIENSRIIVAGMTQGAVCVGSTATYAIADHFWGWFLRPEVDPSVLDPKLGLRDLGILSTIEEDFQPNRVEKGLIAVVDAAWTRRGQFSKDLDAALKILVGHGFVMSEDMRETLRILRDAGISGKRLISALRHYQRTVRDNYRYQEAFENALRGHLYYKRAPNDFLKWSDVWTGDGDPSFPDGNPNAWLNITRHGRNVSVQHSTGEGMRPQSIWLVSYSNFERLYYNLVATYREWGSIAHKIATWRHMSYVRLEAEDLAISMLPPTMREGVRSQFTRGLGRFKNDLHFPLWANRPMGFKIRQADTSTLGLGGSATAVSSVVLRIRDAMVFTKPSAAPAPSAPAGLASLLNSVESLLQKQETAPDTVQFARFLPDVMLVRVHDRSDKHHLLSLVVDRGYLAHNIMVAEDLNRDPQADRLTMYLGLVGAYPNAFLDLSSRESDQARFVQDLAAIDSEKARDAFLQRWGIARNSPRFWPFFDWLHGTKALSSRRGPSHEQGVVDLSQYAWFRDSERKP